MNSTLWIMVTCPCVINLSLWWDFTVFPTTVTDSSLALRMTPFVLRHYDAFRSPLLVTCFPQIVILNGGKNALWEKRETERWNGVKNLCLWWRLTAFPHYGNRSFTFVQDDVFRSPSLWRFPFPITSDVLSSNRHSERRQACRMRKTGNGMVTQSEESMTLMASYCFPSLQQQIFCCCFVWHLTEIICFGF